MKSYTKTYLVNAELKLVFKALSQDVEIEQWSGASAVMNLEANGIFSLWGGSVSGRNILVDTERIEQKWKMSNWSGYSNVNIILKDLGCDTQLSVVQENIPDGAYDELAKYWDTYYFEPLKQYLENKTNSGK